MGLFSIYLLLKVKMKTQLNEVQRMQKLAGLINESQLDEDVNEFNSTGFTTAIKEKLENLGYKIVDFSSDKNVGYEKILKSIKTDENGKYATVGVVHFQGGAEVVVAINSGSNTEQYSESQKAMEEILKPYKDFQPRLNREAQGKILIAGIKKPST